MTPLVVILVTILETRMLEVVVGLVVKSSTRGN